MNACPCYDNNRQISYTNKQASVNSRQTMMIHIKWTNQQAPGIMCEPDYYVHIAASLLVRSLLALTVKQIGSQVHSSMPRRYREINGHTVYIDLALFGFKCCICIVGGNAGCWRSRCFCFN